MFKVGDKVKYMGEWHDLAPEWYPEYGTVGRVCELAEFDVRVLLVQWPVGSTSEDDAWWVAAHNLIKEE